MKSSFLLVTPFFLLIACKPRDFNSESLSSTARDGLHPLEKVFPDEERHTAEAVKLAEEGVETSKKTLGGKSGRDAHTKAHGCVRAAVTVKDDIPKEYRVGIFSEAKTFPAWVRYSAAAGERKPDSESGALGMALKLMTVPGKKILETEANETTHDFLAVNFPIFLVPDIKEYVALQKWKLLYAARHWSTAKIFNTIKGLKSADPAEERYWSMAAYALGQTAVKFSFIPCETKTSVYPQKPTDDFRAELLEQHLGTRDACYKFALQPYVNDKLTPVEDPMQEWKESDSAFTEVATIQIPKQSFRSKEQQEFCENLSFTPWHALPEHRPLGNLNRARKKVYEATSKKRHGDNKIQRTEPVPQ